MHIYTYNIPLTPSPWPLRSRQGLILRTENGWGEAAPLPLWSPESLSEAIDSIHNRPTPSIDFANACANLPFPTVFPMIQISALVRDLCEAKNAIRQGFRTLKIKVKNVSLEAVSELISSLPRNIMIRIDANRGWTLDEALRFYKILPFDRIEYIEEPLQDPQELFRLPPIPLALDESLINPNAEKWVKLPNVAALILKPTLLGSRLNRWIEIGQILEKKLVFSSCLESGIGLVHLAHLQKRFSPDVAAGLDTHRFFTGNFLPWPIVNGKLSSQPIPPLDCSWLQELAR